MPGLARALAGLLWGAAGILFKQVKRKELKMDFVGAEGLGGDRFF